MKHVLNGILIAVFLTFSLAQTSYAQNTWTVSNDSGFDADFDNLQEAIDSANAGDKIYIHGSPVSYASFTLDKRLHLIGPGYWRMENMIPGSNLLPAHFPATCSVIASADSSIIEGLYFSESNPNTGSLAVGADYVTARYNRCVVFRFNGNPSNVLVYGNSVESQFIGGANNTQVYNNIFPYWYLGLVGTNVTLQNNAITRTTNSSFANCTLRNNIVASTDFSITNCIIENNIIADSIVIVNGVPTDSLGNGNIDSVDIATIWDLTNPSPDGKYQLVGDSTTNVAFGAGINGEDCGPFGGDSPYRLSGIVRIPSIYQMLIPLVGDTTNMLKVKIRAKSN